MNNLGVALLNQGKLKEVRSCLFSGVPCPWCSLHSVATLVIGSFVRDVVFYHNASVWLPCGVSVCLSFLVGHRIPRGSFTEEPV